MLLPRYDGQSVLSFSEFYENGFYYVSFQSGKFSVAKTTYSEEDKSAELLEALEFGFESFLYDRLYNLHNDISILRDRLEEGDFKSLHLYSIETKEFHTMLTIASAMVDNGTLDIDRVESALEY